MDTTALSHIEDRRGTYHRKGGRILSRKSSYLGTKISPGGNWSRGRSVVFRIDTILDPEGPEDDV